LGCDREQDRIFVFREYGKGGGGVNADVVVITPELSTGGVGDYTLRLLENWPKTTNVKILSSRNDPASISLLYPLDNLGSYPSAILEQLPADNGKVFVQYSAYGFDSLGYPRKLIRALVDWKKRTRGRLVIMFHEIWTFWPVTNKNFFVQYLHQRAIKRLLQCADEVFTSTESQAEHLRALWPRSVHVLPVGSNIRRQGDVDPGRIPGCAILFGLQDGRIHALKKMQSSLTSLARAGDVTKLISVGAGGDSHRDAEESALLAAFGLKDGFEQLGPRSEAEVSRLLLTASFGIFAQDQLSLSKSGTFMAYAGHGLNVLADFADVSMPEPICWLVAPRELLGNISESELKTRAEGLAAWQQQTSAWSLIAKAFGEALDLDSTTGSQAGGSGS
jgi:glycosyltransferase involved in cell wall biosynthesis